MDITETLKAAGLTGTMVTIILLAYRLVKTMQGKRIVSSCCGKRIDIGFDVQDMTPPHSGEQDTFTTVNPAAVPKIQAPPPTPAQESV